MGGRAGAGLVAHKRPGDCNPGTEDARLAAVSPIASTQVPAVTLIILMAPWFIPNVRPLTPLEIYPTGLRAIVAPLPVLEPAP